MTFMENLMARIAKIQHDFAIPLFILIFIFTIIMFVGATKIEMNSDINEEMPTYLPIFKLNDKVADKFGGQDTLFILFRIDEDQNNKDSPRDIRDPEVMDYLIRLQDSLEDESSFDDIVSLASFMKISSFSTLDDVVSILGSIPGSSNFISDDLKTTFMLIKVDVGSGEKKTIQVTELIEEKLAQNPLPSGVIAMITGSAPIRVTILDILQSDAMYTVALASLIILILLFFMEKSISKGFLVFAPLFFGLIWTIGLMGWAGIKLSIATVGIGAMILGLGVEYGVFMYTRYFEEREKGNDQLDSIQVAVPAVGISILGSGTTTIVGFLALTLSSFPMMAHLGSSLAMGIASCLVAAIFAAPVIFILEERFERWYKCKIYDLVEDDVIKHRSEYKEFITKEKAKGKEISKSLKKTSRK